MKPILEKVPLGKKNTIIGFSYEDEDFMTPWHWHPQHELTYIDESVGTKFIGDYVGAYASGELVLLRANLPHYWKNTKQTDKHAKSVVVQWNKNVIPNIPELESVNHLLSVAGRGLLFDKVSTVQYITHVKQLTLLSGHELYLGLVEILSGLATCPYQTLSSSNFTTGLNSRFENRMLGVHDFISSHFQQRIYLKDIAERLKMSEQTFSRFFTKMMGRPFFTFLNEYRVNIAVRMLLDTEQSISEIGYACGYESLPFFFKQFQKYKHCTPLTYRKAYRED